jgi:hypothetical protein
MRIILAHLGVERADGERLPLDGTPIKGHLAHKRLVAPIEKQTGVVNSGSMQA